MKTNVDIGYRKALGARILNEANDLKRTRQALAQELGVSQELVDSVIDGAASVTDSQALMRLMVETYPISLSDLWLERDDSDAGVIIMRAESSQRTARVFERKDGNGELMPYYEYRDTAMSRLGPFKPEWIKELRTVDDADPENPEVAYNNGHLMHQQTFFVGEVNFYWSSGGKNYCAEMNTGDSNYISPFVPHSFASRNPEALGLIIAVTFGGEVRRALGDFSRIGADAANELASDLRDADIAYQARLMRYLAADSMVSADLLERLVSQGLNGTRAAELADGVCPASFEENCIVSEALGIRPEDLMITPLFGGGEVVVRRADEGSDRLWPCGDAADCRLPELARTKHMPALKGFMVEVMGNSPDAPSFRHHLYEYIYNYGREPVAFYWDDGRESQLQPGDSVCVFPMVGHRFGRPSRSGHGNLCIVRVPGPINDASINEYATFDLVGRQRVSAENKQWF